MLGEETHSEDTKYKEEVKRTKVEHSNYKEFFKMILENFKENPKYPQSALKMLEKGHNIFHVSVLDI